MFCATGELRAWSKLMEMQFPVIRCFHKVRIKNVAWRYEAGIQGAYRGGDTADRCVSTSWKDEIL